MERSPPRPIDIANKDNNKQREPDQNQAVAADTLNAVTDLAEDSERGGRSNRGQVAPEDTPDLVETMNGMVRSGQVDRNAFAGEPEMDDEEDELGRFEDKYREEDGGSLEDDGNEDDLREE